jgi:hypothetical protein
MRALTLLKPEMDVAPAHEASRDGLRRGWQRLQLCAPRGEGFSCASLSDMDLSVPNDAIKSAYLYKADTVAILIQPRL